MENSGSSEYLYDLGVQAFNRKNLGRGTYLDLNYQNNTEFIELMENRFEARPSR